MADLMDFQQRRRRYLEQATVTVLVDGAEINRYHEVGVTGDELLARVIGIIDPFHWRPIEKLHRPTRVEGLAQQIPQPLQESQR